MTAPPGENRDPSRAGSSSGKTGGFWSSVGAVTGPFFRSVGASLGSFMRWVTALGHEVWVMLGAMALAAATVYVATQDPPNTLAAGIMQGITIVLTVYASLIVGRGHGEKTAREILSTHAMSAWRRMRNLYGALGRQHEAINSQADRLAQLLRENGDIDFEYVRSSMQTLDMMVTEQISTADDALEDWRSLIPAEVERIEREARRMENDHG